MFSWLLDDLDVVAKIVSTWYELWEPFLARRAKGIDCDTADLWIDQSPRLSMGQLGFGSLSKSHGLVHETGLAPEHAPDPSEHEASSLAKLAHKSVTNL